MQQEKNKTYSLGVVQVIHRKSCHIEVWDTQCSRDLHTYRLFVQLKCLGWYNPRYVSLDTG